MESAGERQTGRHLRWRTWATALVEAAGFAALSISLLIGLLGLCTGPGAMIVTGAAIRKYDLQLIPSLSPAANVLYWRVAMFGWGVAGVVGFIGLVRSLRRPFGWSHGGWWLLGSLGLIVALFFSAPRRIDLPPKIASLAGFERMSGMKLPAGTMFVEARGYNGWKEVVQAKVYMREEAFRSFICSGFADSSFVPGEEQPEAQVEHLKRMDVGMWPKFMYDWALPAGDNLIIATAGTFYAGDGHDALAVAAKRPGGMLEVVLQYVRA